MSALMFGNMNPSISTEMNSADIMNMSSHQHHQMDSGADMNDDMDMQAIDCCQSDCANCLASCHYSIPIIALKLPFINSKEAIHLALSEPLVQPPASLFRPPIAA